MKAKPNQITRPKGRFQPGQSGNPKGRPKGTKSKPKEISFEQEAENLLEQGMKHVVNGHNNAAHLAFRKSFTLMGLRLPEDIDNASDGLIDVAKDELMKMQRLDIVRGLYDDADTAYLRHVGLPKSATWDRFCGLYAIDDGDVDADRAINDLVTFPRVAKAIAELKAAGRKQVS